MERFIRAAIPRPDRIKEATQMKKALRTSRRKAAIQAKKIGKMQFEPLPATFTLTSIFGLVITTVFTFSGRIPLSWGVAFDLVFAIMFIASMVSITPRLSMQD